MVKRGQFYTVLKQKNKILIVATTLFLFGYVGIANAAPPVVDVNISLEKTGSEPFDTSDNSDNCTDGNTFDAARLFNNGDVINDGDNGVGHDGKDACSDNDVVRLGDSVTYKVEVSNNDSDVDYLTATVSLEPYNQATQAPDAAGTIHQEWIEIPSGCETDPQFAVPSSELQDLDGDGRNETLFCNMGFAREGTNKVFFPASKVLGVSTDSTAATLNDSLVGASVQAEGISNSPATGSNGTSTPANAGPVEALVTADFRVNLTKEMNGFATTPDGSPLYPRLDPTEGPAGEDGYLAEFNIIANYLNGSMIADSPDELSDTDGDTYLYDADYDLIDIFTDDSTNNDGTFSAGGLLYTWGTDKVDCELLGDHGPGASVTCTQADHPFDWTGPTFTADGTNDRNIHVDLDNIDTRDPNGDNNLIYLRLRVWIPKSDVDGHQSCIGATCQYFYINEIQGFDTGTNSPNLFAPVSTEDAAGSNLSNYNSAPEPGGDGSATEHSAASDNITNGQLFVSSPGTWSYRKTFQRTSDGVADTRKIQDQLRAYGEEFPVALVVFDYRQIDGARSQICDKIDTTQYEFAGVPAWDKWPLYPSPDGPFLVFFWTAGSATYPRSTQNNPSLRTWNGAQANTLHVFSDGEPVSTTLYSAVSNGTGSLVDVEQATCDDDANGDGFVNIMDAAGVESSPGNPVDWYEDYTMVPDAADGTSGVTKIRLEYVNDYAYNESNYNEFGGVSHKNTALAQLYDLRVRDDATGYGPLNYMPNYADARRSVNTDNSAWEAWQDNSTDDVHDPNHVSFGYNIFSADRNILVPSGIGVAKQTDPEGIKVVRGGDTVDFVITPQAFGLWAGTQTGDVIDNLPAGTDYIAGSEEFSVDGGATWMDHATYNASSPDVVLDSAPTPGGQDPITWSFSSIDAGEQMPMIRYKVRVDPALTSGNFTNTVTFSSPNIAADKLTIDTDGDDINDSGDGVGDDVKATYRLTILPKFGFDVLKQVGQEVYNTEEEFVFDLTYKNLGAETYTGGQFIDILPFNGDAATTIGGEQSERDPATNYTGVYEFTQATFGNSETFWVTDEDPSTLNLDPCASSNTANGYVPVAGDICYQDYVNNGDLLPDGVAAGTGSANWQACTAGASPLDVEADCPIAPVDVTAFRFEAPSVPTTGGQTVNITLHPIGNVGGDPVYTTDSNGVQIVDWANSPNVGDIYTNSFGGRIPEISLNVISNDVSVTPVSGSVGDLVWWDYDADGTVNGSDGPIAGVELALIDAAGNPLYWDSATGAVITSGDVADYEAATGTTLAPYTATTDAAGNYLFDNLPSGDFDVQVVTQVGSPTYDLDDGLLANDNIASFTLGLQADAITGNITGVQDRDDVDFGYDYNPDIAIDKTVDGDGDGVFSDSEILPVPGVLGNPDPTVFTYRITVTNESTVATGTGIDLTDVIPPGVSIANISPAVGATLPVTGAAGTGTPLTWTIGTMTPGASLTYDLTAELTAADVPTFAAGFDANKSDQNVAEISAMTETDFDSTPGNADSADYGGATTGFDPSTSEDDEDDARVTIPPAIGDFVWHDQDYDGVQDVGEPGIGGVTVNLYDSADNLIASAITGADGAYYFGDLDDTLDYYVEFDHNSASLANFLPTLQDQGGDDTADSDGDPTTGQTSTYDIAPGEVYPDFDMGYVQKHSIGNRVFFDADGDTTQDAGEVGIGGVTVELLDGAGNPVLDSGGSPIMTTTDADGYYLFTDLYPGDYIVHIPTQAALTGFTGTDAAVDPDDTPTDEDSHSAGVATGWQSPIVTLENANEPTAESGGSGPQTDNATDENSNLTVDFGFTQPDVALALTTTQTDPIAPGDDVTYTITITNQGGIDISNIDIVNYIPTGMMLSPNDTNGWTGGPTGQVTNTYANTLASGGGTGTIDIVLTTDNANLPPTGNNTILVNEAEVTEFDTPNGTLTSDADSTQNNDPTDDAGASDATVNGAADNYIDGDGTGIHDDGIDTTDEDDHDPEDVTVEWGSIGNYIWEDTNADGIQDGSELPIENITVNLLDENGNPVLDVLGNPITATTDATGNYTFTHVPFGTYQVEVDTTTLPAGYIITYDADGNADLSGVEPADHLSEISIDSASPDNDAQDFGYIPGASLGNYVWEDSNNDGIQDAGENPLPNVVLTLIGSDGNPVLDSTGSPVTATTDATGAYQFTDLLPGDYSVTVDPSTLPADYLQTFDLDEGTGGRDNASGTVTLFAGDNNEDLDFGYLPAASIGDYVWIDANDNGVIDSDEAPLEGITVNLLDENGDPVHDDIGNPITATTDATGTYIFSGLYPGTYQTAVDETTIPEGLIQTYDLDDGTDASNHMSGLVTVTAGEDNLTLDYGYVEPAAIAGTVWFDSDNSQNQGDAELGTAGVVVELLDENGNVLGVTTTDENGNYEFLNLVPGNYQVRITPPEGYVQTYDNDGDSEYIILDINLQSGQVLGDFDFGLITPEELELLAETGVPVAVATIGAVLISSLGLYTSRATRSVVRFK